MVRATFAGFGTALSALQANQKRLDITGQNLSNMNTAGYTRQQLQVSSLNYTHPISHYMNGSEISVGFGVSMDTVTQIRDPFLDAQYRNQMQKSGYSNAMQTSLDRLATFLDESHITGITNAFNDIQSTLTNMHDLGKVNDPIYEAELRTRMQALTNLLNQSARDIEQAKMEEYNRLDGTGTSEQGAVQKVNDILQQIGSLNRQIKQNQIHGQPSLELMDERNVLLDELASYIPIEVTYKKDRDHDGIKNGTGENGTPAEEDLSEIYHVDSAGRPIAKKDWPDDLYVKAEYIDKDGNRQTLDLINGTEGIGEENHMKVKIPNSADILSPGGDPGDVKLEFYNLNSDGSVKGNAVVEIGVIPAAGTTPAATVQFSSGSIQSSLDMLWKDGKTDGLSDVKGYDYYMNELDRLAGSFAKVMNTLNNVYNGDKDPVQNLLVNKDTGQIASITAANIGINLKWVNGDVHVNSKGDNATDTVLLMKEAMEATYPYSGFSDGKGEIILDSNKDPILKDIDLNGNSFANFMTHVSTVHANDSYSNQVVLKNNVTVLNGIQNSRDSVSGVSLDEEASNMMMYMSAYSASSRLMTTLDEALNTLINGTGLVGR